MGVLSTALAKLAALPVSGAISFALDETPGALTRAQLPALVVVPELGGESPGLEPGGFSAGDGRLVVAVAHVLLLAPLAGGAGPRGALPALAAAIDAYFTALAADPTLDGALAVPLRCALRAGVVSFGGADYHGAVFTHTWTLHVGGE
jgi:hypothetical protein